MTAEQVAARWPHLSMVRFTTGSLFGLVLVAIGLTAVLRAVSEPGLAAPASSPAQEQTAREGYAKLPLVFVPNAGQSDARVRYSAQAGGATFYFTREEAVFAFTKGTKGAVLRLGFVGANPRPVMEGRRLGPGRVNFLRGGDPAKWQTDLPTYGQVVYRDLWPGVDMVFRGAAGQLKYEFVLKPGARVGDIALRYRGARDLSVNGAGALVIGTPLGALRDERPRSYQVRGGKQVPVASRYVLRGGARYGFAVAGGYDRARPLVIDPGLVYSTFLGGQDNDRAYALAVDGAGSAYVTGDSFFLPGFPTTAGAFDPTYNGGGDAFVTKLNPAGSALVYSTFLGGFSFDSGLGIAVDSNGNAYVTGETMSPNFPTTLGAFDPTFNFGQDDAFVTKLNPAGSALVYSTFLGGSSRDFGFAIALGPNANAYVSGDTSSGDFPTTAGAFDMTFNGGDFDGFVTRLNAAGSALVYSTYLGGSARDDARGIAVDGGGSAYVSSDTFSGNFPTTAGAFDTTFNGASDVAVTKLNPAGTALVYSTFLGGTSTEGAFADVAVAPKIDIDSDRRAYVTATTTSLDFPTTPGAYQPASAGGADAFVTRLNSTGAALSYSTYLGGSADDVGLAIAVDRQDDAYVAGSTDAADFPTTAGSFDTTFNGASDAFVARLGETGSTLAYSTFLGGSSTDGAIPLFSFGEGIAVDGEGSVYVVGDTLSPDFPTSTGAFDQTYNGATDAFVTKLDVDVCPDDDVDDDGLSDERELLFLALLANPDSDADGVKDGNEDSDDDGDDDEDEDDDEDDCPNDSDDDGEDDEDEDDEDD
jgi:Beta-propeller repeat